MKETKWSKVEQEDEEEKGRGRGWAGAAANRLQFEHVKCTWNKQKKDDEKSQFIMLYDGQVRKKVLK